jgi:hypothetical protein
MQTMKIIEKTNDVLTLRDLAIDHWLGMAFLFFGGPPLIVMFAMLGGWWHLGIPLFFWCFGLSLQQIWASDVVKECSFNKAIGKGTIKFHGLKTKIKEFSLQGAQVEVRETTAIVYGTVSVHSHLWLITQIYGDVPLSAEGSIVRPDKAKAIAEQVQEFLYPSDYPTRQL